MFEALSLADRIVLAKEKTKRVVDHLLYLLELHENNAFIVYSSVLSSQIPRSYAANAFNVFQRGMHQFEIVRLCALWDRAEEPRENIPTIVELVDHSDVIERIVEETRSQWPVGDGFGQEQANRARSELTQAISDAREILKSKRLASIMNLRDKHLAHSLSKTRRERKIGPVAPMKYGDEREVLSRSLAIVEVFYRWVNSTGFSFADSRQIDRKNAEALWTRCTFDIKSRTHD